MKKLIKNSRGQGVMEYVILSSLIGIFCLFAVKQYGGTIKKKIELMEKKIDKQIRIW
ncbi:MAG: hypothetical protein H6622_14810 [Halobacteriovoraceae bacterium]|nr:hypothetical protein [Halobacteriovoraceae bacterium]